jgi:hypothetical protein
VRAGPTAEEDEQLPRRAGRETGRTATAKQATSWVVQLPQEQAAG